jgi:Ca2+-binding RTX toxin-like protein
VDHPPPEDEEGKGMSRRTPILLVAIAVMVALFATVAYAAVIEGTDKDDVLLESNQSDTIHGNDGFDTIRAYRFSRDEDNLYGDAGRDTLNARDGDNRDTLNGGKGDDVCKGDPLDTYHNCQIINP